MNYNAVTSRNYSGVTSVRAGLGIGVAGMAMAVQVSLMGTDRVVDRALAIYGAHLERAVHVPLADMVDREVAVDVARLSVVAAGESRVAEIMVDETVVCQQLTLALWSLADQGWQATVVVPAARMGEAHQALRGVPCRLQAWWEDETLVCFGAHETP
jgi:hypothetical protein